MQEKYVPSLQDTPENRAAGGAEIKQVVKEYFDLYVRRLNGASRSYPDFVASGFDSARGDLKRKYPFMDVGTVGFNAFCEVDAALAGESK